MMSRSISIRVLVLVVVVAVFTQCVQAELIMFIHEGSGEATLDGQSLGEVDFVITAYGDTDDRIQSSIIPNVVNWEIAHKSASISMDVDGSGVSYDFLLPTRTYCLHNGPMDTTIGFVGGVGSDLAYGWNYPAWDWDMLSSIGPITSGGAMIQWADEPVTTTGGVLYFEDNIMNTTFEAIVVPEPTTLLLVGLGAVMVRRRRN